MRMKHMLLGLIAINIKITKNILSKVFGYKSVLSVKKILPLISGTLSFSSKTSHSYKPFA